MCTPRKIKMSLEKGPFLNGSFIFQPSIFEGYVCFQRVVATIFVGYLSFTPTCASLKAPNVVKSYQQGTPNQGVWKRRKMSTSTSPPWFHGFRRLFFLLLNFTGNILIYCLWWKKSNSPVEVGSLLLCFARSDFFHLRWFQIFLECSPRFLGKMISNFWFHPLLENFVERSN